MNPKEVKLAIVPQGGNAAVDAQNCRNGAEHSEKNFVMASPLEMFEILKVEGLDKGWVRFKAFQSPVDAYKALVNVRNVVNDLCDGYYTKNFSKGLVCFFCHFTDTWDTASSLNRGLIYEFRNEILLFITDRKAHFTDSDEVFDQNAERLGIFVKQLFAC